MRRTAEEAAQTRESLLQAGLYAFEERGWRGATFDHIAGRAGLSKGALHHHFSDKYTLMTEAMSAGWRRYGAALFADLHGDQIDQLSAVLVRYVRLLGEDPGFRALAATTVLVAPQAQAEAMISTAGEGRGWAGHNDALDGWKQHIQAMISHSDAPPRIDPSTVAALVVTILEGLTITAVTRPGDIPRSDQASAVMRALVAGLLTAEG